jgi:EAL domain-containing protein (putative c-di-GMP-specific phosphodiesterase class I)
MEQLRLLRDNGYRIWLDDFGSGYSSLSMFSHYDFDLVKFDMDLLRHLDDKGGINRILLKDLMQMVRELKLHTLIEGVETEEQLEFVKSIGCELGQGFYFDKPHPLDDILFRIQHGESVKICETDEERRELNSKL